MVNMVNIIPAKLQCVIITIVSMLAFSQKSTAVSKYSFTGLLAWLQTLGLVFRLVNLFISVKLRIWICQVLTARKQ